MKTGAVTFGPEIEVSVQACVRGLLSALGLFIYKIYNI